MTFFQLIHFAKKSIITLIGTIAIIYLAVILVSHSASDPSWSHISSNVGTIANMGGAHGAWLSDLLLTFLGNSSWILILFIGYEIVLQWWTRHSFLPILRWLGYAFLLFAISGLFTMSSTIGQNLIDLSTGDLHIPYLLSQEMLSRGGIIGYELAIRLQLLLSSTWTWVFLPLFVLIISTLIFDIRWRSLFSTLISLKWLGSGVQEDQNVHVVKQPPAKEDDDYYEEGISAEDYLLDGVESQDLSAYAVESAFDRTYQVKTSQVKASEKQIPLNFTKEKKDTKGNTTSIKNQATIPSNQHSRDDLIVKKESKSTIKTNSQQVDGINHQGNEKTNSTNSNNSNKEIVINKIKQSAMVSSAETATENNNLNSEAVVYQETQDNQDINQQSEHTDKPTQEKTTSRKPSTVISEFAKTYFSKRKEAKKEDASEDELMTEQVAELLDEPMENAQKNPSNSTMIPVTGATANTTNTTEQATDDTAGLNFDYFADVEKDLSTEIAKEVNAKTYPQNSDTEAKLNYDYDSDNDVDVDVDVNDNGYLDSYADNDDAVTDYLQADYSESNATTSHAEISDSTSNDLTNSDLKNAHNKASSPTTANRSSSSSTGSLNTSNIQLADISDDEAFVGKSRAFQTAKYRSNLSAIPSLDILDLPDPDRKPSYTDAEIEELSELLEIKLQDFNIKAEVINAIPGPVVTRFEVDLAPGVKASKVVNISRDLARSLSMASLRVVEVIPGKPYIGIEIPNKKREMVRLIELLDTDKYRDPHAQISMAMGKDIGGKPIITDLAKAPHMLVAGTTGSGKSVLVNSMLLSMLLKYTPDELRLILIDPKQLELANYNDIPHLLTPVVTDMTEAAGALSWCVAEMERRYQLMSLLRVRKLKEFNKKVAEAAEAGNPIIDPLWRPNDSVSIDKAPKLKPLPMIVIVADEFADMIMQVGKQAEEIITRLAQKSRAAGIHLMLATQRPSVDVITGLIKANVPVRSALRVNSKIDSRTILDQGGAEDMLGNGDMLFLGPGQIEPERVHGAFVSDEEVNRVCEAWRERGAPNYIENFTEDFQLASSDSTGGSSGGTSGEDDKFYSEAVAFVLESGKVSASSIQRKFSIGYNRAARIVDSMEQAGIVGPMIRGKREILMK